jgi:hypothetical protein
MDGNPSGEQHRNHSLRLETAIFADQEYIWATNLQKAREELSSMRLAEYIALMSKSSSLVNLMFGIMAIGFAYLGIIIGHWPDEAEQKIKVFVGMSSAGTGGNYFLVLIAVCTTHNIPLHRGSIKTVMS